MSDMSISEIKQGFEPVFNKLHGTFKDKTFISAAYEAIGHIWINNVLVEVQVCLERNPEEWHDEDYACEVLGEE